MPLAACKGQTCRHVFQLLITLWRFVHQTEILTKQINQRILREAFLTQPVFFKAPAIRAGSDGKPEEYAEEARYFVEVRLLQRDVEVILESTSNQNLVGSVLHPKGNIAELLLREGFAKCVDWSIALATSGPEPLRAAEK